MIYEIINPSDACTVESDCPIAAWLAMLVISEGHYGLKGEDDNVLPFMPFGLTLEGVEKVLRDDFGELITLKDAFHKYNAQMAECLESFVYGSRRERSLYLEALSHMTPEGRVAYAKKHRDAKRTSMSDIGKACEQYAKAMRAKAEKELAQ